MPKVWFVGAGPGDPDLITVKGRDQISRAGAILGRLSMNFAVILIEYLGRFHGAD